MVSDAILKGVTVGEDGQIVISEDAYEQLQKQAEKAEETKKRQKARNNANAQLKSAHEPEWDEIYNAEFDPDSVETKPLEFEDLGDGRFAIGGTELKTLQSVWESQQLNGERTRARNVANKAIERANPDEYQGYYMAACEALGVTPSTGRGRTRNR